MVKLPGVVPPPLDRLSHDSGSVTVYGKNSALQPKAFIVPLVPPPGGAAQVVSETHRVAGFGSCVTVMVFGDPLIPVAVTVTVADRSEPVVLIVAVIVKFPGVLPLAGATVSQATPSLTVQPNDVLFPQFVTLIDGLVPPESGAAQELSDTQSRDPIEGCSTTMVSGEPEMPVAEMTIFAMREAPVLLLSTAMVKLSGVAVPLAFDSCIQSAVSVAVQANDVLLPQFVTLTNGLVPPVSGAVQVLGDTHNTAPDACVTVTVFGDPLISAAVTVTVAVRIAPVAFAVAVIVKLPGVVPLAGATVSQVTPSLTVQLNDVLLPQFVMETDGLAPPESGAAQALGDTHNTASDV